MPAEGAELCPCAPGAVPAREGQPGGLSPVGQEWAGGPVVPRGSRNVAQHPLFPSCLCHVLGSWAAALGSPGWGAAQFTPVVALGAARALVSHRGLPHPAAQPFSGDFTTSTSVSSPLRPAGTGRGSPHGAQCPHQLPLSAPGALGRVQPLVRDPFSNVRGFFVPRDPPKPVWGSSQAAQPTRTALVEQPRMGLSCPKDGPFLPPHPPCEQCHPLSPCHPCCPPGATQAADLPHWSHCRAVRRGGLMVPPLC